LQVPTKKQFVSVTFDTLVKAKSEPALTAIVTPIFALEKLETQLSEMPHVLQLSALLDERVRDFTSAVRKLERVCSIYEQHYEETESDDDLVKFAQSKADLARMYLGLDNYPEAIESASMALDLSGDIPQLQTCRLSAHLTSGLAHYYSHQMDDSLEMFKAALAESEENPDVVCLLSQVLWAKGGEEERDVARDQLFATIEANPEHLGSILLLGTIGVLDKSQDVAEAVLDDLRSFRAKEGLPREVKEKIDNLLTAIAQLSSSETSGLDTVSIATSAVFMRPAATENWSRLATIAEDVFAAETALRVAQRAKDCDCERLAKAYAGIATIGCDLRAIFLAPWLVDGWEALARDVVA
jgi:superkiller protein 3